MYKYISQTWRDIWSDSSHRKTYLAKKIRWRRERVLQRVEKPSRLDRARALGYRAKRGYVAVRVRVSRGGLRRIPPKLGRRQKRTGISRIKRGKSMKKIAEEKVARRYRNLEVLGSYYMGEDGRYKWFEVILRDPSHPVIKSSIT